MLAVIVVKAPVEAELDPIALLLIVPPDIVRSLSIFASEIEVAFQVPDAVSYTHLTLPTICSV